MHRFENSETLWSDRIYRNIIQIGFSITPPPMEVQRRKLYTANIIARSIYIDIYTVQPTKYTIVDHFFYLSLSPFLSLPIIWIRAERQGSPSGVGRVK